jgi:hypothetical protein
MNSYKIILSTSFKALRSFTNSAFTFFLDRRLSNIRREIIYLSLAALIVIFLTFTALIALRSRSGKSFIIFLYVIPSSRYTYRAISSLRIKGKDKGDNTIIPIVLPIGV